MSDQISGVGMDCERSLSEKFNWASWSMAGTVVPPLIVNTSLRSYACRSRIAKKPRCYVILVVTKYSFTMSASMATILTISNSAHIWTVFPRMLMFYVTCMVAPQSRRSCAACRQGIIVLRLRDKMILSLGRLKTLVLKL